MRLGCQSESDSVLENFEVLIFGYRKLNSDVNSDVVLEGASVLSEYSGSVFLSTAFFFQIVGISKKIPVKLT